MDPSNEFDELFIEMQNTERSNAARLNSLMKLQDRVGRRKKRHIAPIFISILMVSVAVYLMISLINQSPNPTNHLAAVIENEDKNKAAIRAVLEKEFTGPDEEYLLLVDELHRQQTDPTYEKYVGDAQPPDDRAYTAYVEETYSPYFTESGLDGFIMATPAFRFHHPVSILNLDYQLSISKIEVVQSDNPNTPKSYSFIGLVEYEDEVGETSQFEVQGEAICSEEGKIGRIQFSATELEEKIQNDMNKNN